MPVCVCQPLCVTSAKFISFSETHWRVFGDSLENALVLGEEGGGGAGAFSVQRATHTHSHPHTKTVATNKQPANNTHACALKCARAHIIMRW